MGGWDRQTWQQGAFRLCGPWEEDAHLPCNGLIHSAKCLLPSSQSLQERLFVHDEGCKTPFSCVSSSWERRTELVLHGEIAWAGFICSICIFLLGMLIKRLLRGLCHVEVYPSLRDLERLVEAKPKSLDRHGCSEEIQFLWWWIFSCNIKWERNSGCFFCSITYYACLFNYIRLKTGNMIWAAGVLIGSGSTVECINYRCAFTKMIFQKRSRFTSGASHAHESLHGPEGVQKILL